LPANRNHEFHTPEGEFRPEARVSGRPLQPLRDEWQAGGKKPDGQEIASLLDQDTSSTLDQDTFSTK
jgi:hypothetical protein